MILQTLMPLVAALCAFAPPPSVPNAGFEEVNPATGFAAGWIRGVGTGTRGGAELDTAVAHSGARSLRITDATPFEAYKYVLVNTPMLPAAPQETCVVRFWARGRSVGKAMVGVAFQGGGEHREPLPVGDYEWRPVSLRFTTPAGCRQISLQFVADGLIDALWIDDVAIERSSVQLANVPASAELRPYTGWFPRTPPAPPGRLVVADIAGAGTDVGGLLTALQGIVNRCGPRLYLINPTNPAGQDTVWLSYMRSRKYTLAPERLTDPMEAIRRFRAEIRGVIVWDPELPGSRNAAWMLAGILNALPASPETARRVSLPVVMDLRGRWKRNVDAYRWVYERYWPRMSHHLLAWEYPLTNALSSRDVMVQNRVFLFWVSSYTDREPGADPGAEMAFVEEVLARTPGNVPVMGWPMYGDRGIEEYTAVRLLSEYGKWVPGTGYNSNVSVHSALRPSPAIFRQRFRRVPAPTTRPDPAKVYISVNILDSGDAHWYWQLYQRGIWADPVRGALPIAYGMNPTLVEVLPLVAQWYYEQMTPNDQFFGLLYMNAPVYGSRFRAADRERIWSEFLTLTSAALRRMDMDGLEIYTGGSGGASASTELLRRYTRGIKGLRYLIAGLGRHADITGDTGVATVDDTVVWHTLTNFRVWTVSEDLHKKKMAEENAWLLGEIAANTPAARPGFMSALAISWIYYPTWLRDLKEKLPTHYVVVSPSELTRLYRSRSRPDH